jgi:hypothetical protein
MRKTPATLGVLSMVFGSLVGLYSVVGVVFSTIDTSFFGNLGAMARALPPKPGEPDPAVLFGRVQEMMKAIAPYTQALLVGKIVFSAMLIVIGYGLYQRRRWSRSGAIAWSTVALLFTVAEMIVRVGFIQPRVDAAMRDVAAGASNPSSAAMIQALSSSSSLITAVFTLLVYAPYPTVLLVLCGRRSAAADFID